MKKALLLPFLFLLSGIAKGQLLQTVFEKSNGRETATYFETIAYYQQLDKKFDNITLKTFDTTDAGYPLHLVLFSKDMQFDPKKWHRQGKVVILINNGIHPGEPDGIDASMILLRDLASAKIAAPENVVIGFIPVYNIGGSLNRNSSSRVNQQGPVSYGFRGNAQNLDLNRDFTKVDSRNAKAFTNIFHFLNPDIFVDNHVSDGADYQYTMTLLTTQPDKLGGAIGTFLRKTFEPALYKNMQQKNWPMTPYVNFEEGNADKGWTAFYDPPRYSSGYAALFQTIAFVPETHTLKPFDQRVKSTYAFMQSLIEQASLNNALLKLNREASIKAVGDQTTFPLSWKVDSTKADKIRFLGYEAATKTSVVTGLPRVYYDHSKPFDKRVNFYNSFLGERIVTAPKAYVIPHGWKAVIDLLKLNGVQMRQLKTDTSILVEGYRIENYKSALQPYEKHHKNSDVVVTKLQQQLKFLKGDYIVYCNQRAKRYIIEMLEPTADDSFFAWNFFDAILQQKEHYSDYRWEDVAAEFIASHPVVKQKLEERKKADPHFAGSASAQLNFVYKNSPYYEPAHMRYPVFRITE
jgi:hypothetical protein